MGSLIKFTPLCGARDNHPLCYLLEIDDACILLDCGWDETFDTRLLRTMLAKDKTTGMSIAQRIDAVLISHPDISHLGALPYAFAKGGMKAKVYATLPVMKLGQLALYDMVQARSDKEDFEAFSLSDIDLAWDNFVQLRYQQNTQLGGKAEGITVCPLSAGHMIGGAVWKITKDSEEVVYAVDYNHAQERLLDGTVLVDLPRPSILITDAYTVLDKPFSGGKRAREGMLIDEVMRTVSRGGNVLLPVDSVGRVFELMVVLDQYWAHHNLQQYTLAFLSSESRSIVDMAASQTEWLSKHVSQMFIQNRSNIFHFKHLKRCCTRRQLARLPGPQVVLASGLDLETSSFALDLFSEWAGDSRNSVILTQRSRKQSTAQNLIEMLVSGQQLPTALALQLSKRVPLEGVELKEYEEAQREKALQAKQGVEGEGAEEGGGKGGEEDEGGGGRGKGGGGGEMMDVEVKVEKVASARDVKRHKGRSEGRFAMYPHSEELRMFDEYGEVIDTSIYLKEEQQEEVQAYIAETITFSGGTTSDPVSAVKKEEEKMDLDVAGSSGPTKSVQFNLKVHRAAQIAFVDFGGRSDANSIHTILGHLRPSKVIIVHGSVDATEAMHTFCVDKVTEPENTSSPAVGETKHVSSDNNIYKVKLASDLAKSLQFVSVGGYDIAHLDAVLEMPEDPAEAVGVNKERGASVPTLAIKPQNKAATSSKAWKPFAFIGEVKLSEMREVLTKEGFKTELKSGMLVVNSSVIIRKSGARVVFEGVMCDDYYSIRKLLLAQYHTL